ncbi:flavin reductase family protein [Motilibacter aurantiacus]|uniref:flavin reductase family protein n=1 Tax=Motilibacter aurantiacus TaxID=2714955 RepID=UPI0014083771|nr:flavin reductase family protein [Motilibacter aurantiacus]NHC45751.1 flavin reductase [Motilibacter aurantiacus]
MTVPAVPLPVPPDPDAFRRVVGRFATGVTVLTTTWGGNDYGMTANAFTSVSLDPLLVLVCVDIEARFHDAAVSAGVWGVSILGQHDRATAGWLATRGRPLHGQLERVPFVRGAATGVPLLSTALATLECTTHAVHDGGDHSILVGEVRSAATPADDEPLLWYRGQYGAHRHTH